MSQRCSISRDGFSATYTNLTILFTNIRIRGYTTTCLVLHYNYMYGTVDPQWNKSNEWVDRPRKQQITDVYWLLQYPSTSEPFSAFFLEGCYQSPIVLAERLKRSRGEICTFNIHLARYSTNAAVSSPTGLIHLAGSKKPYVPVSRRLIL